MSYGAARYYSILGARGIRELEQTLNDLRIPEIVTDILGKDGDEFLKELFFEPLADKDIALYRLRVVGDLLKEDVYGAVSQFVDGVRKALSLMSLEREINYDEHKIGIHLDAALAYINAIDTFLEKARKLTLESEGLSQFVAYLSWIAKNPSFQRLKEQALEAKRARERIRIRVRIKGDEIRVSKADNGESLVDLVRQVFSRFSYEIKTSFYQGYATEITHIHAAILKGAFKIYEQEYAILKNFYLNFPDIIDQGIAQFIHEIEFYIRYIRYMKNTFIYGFTMPIFTHGELYVKGFYNPLLVKGRRVVLNDLEGNGSRRIFVITGMNGGGKTTFATSLGVVAYLARLGLPVPASEARLPFFNKILTAYPVEEGEQVSKLERDVIRAWEILRMADENTLVIANELFTNTTSEEGTQLSRLFLDEVAKRGAYCLYVTFFSEVAKLGYVVSLVTAPHPGDPEKPSYKIVPGPPPSEYMAVRIAKKHSLEYNKIIGMVR
jgi:DNA mismatch repair ATPase MutS